MSGANAPEKPVDVSAEEAEQELYVDENFDPNSTVIPFTLDSDDEALTEETTEASSRSDRNALLDYEDDTFEESHVLYRDALSAHISRNLKAKLLTKEQEIELFTRYGQGDKQAFYAVFEANLRMVVKIARRYHYANVPMEDLIAEGHFGLFRAIEKFEIARGYRFSTYAYHWVNQAIQRAIVNQQRLVRRPVHAEDHLRKLNKLRAIAQTEGRKINSQELANEVGLSVEQVEGLLSLYDAEMSMDTPLGEDGDRTLEGTLTDERDNLNSDNLATSELSDDLKVLFARYLTERESFVLKLRFGLDTNTHTLEDVGRIIGVTRERIRQIEAKALRKLRFRFSAEQITLSDVI